MDITNERRFVDLCDACRGHGEIVLRTHRATHEEPASEETSTCDTCGGTGTVPADEMEIAPPLFVGSTTHHPLLRFDFDDADEAA